MPHPTRFDRYKLSDVPNDITILVTFDPECPAIPISVINKIAEGAALDMVEGTPIALTPILMRHIHDLGGRKFSNADVYPTVDMRIFDIRPPANLREVWTCRLASHGVEVVTPRLLYKSVIEDARIAYIRFHYQMQQEYLKKG